MTRKKRTSTARCIPPEEVAQFTSDHIELLEVIHDMVRLEVDRQIEDVAIRGEVSRYASPPVHR